MASKRAERNRLLANCRERMHRYIGQRDPVIVLDSAALADVRALVEAAPDIERDPEVAFVAGWLYITRYFVPESGGDPDDLTAAIRLFEVVYRERPDAVPDQVRRFLDGGGHAGSPGSLEATDQATALLEEALATGDAAGLYAAIAALRQAFATCPDGSVERGVCLSHLSVALRTRAEWTGEPDDVDEAVDAGLAAVRATPPGRPERPSWLSNLSSALRTKFEQTGDAASLDLAVAASQEAVDALAAIDQDNADVLASLGTALYARYTSTGQLPDLNQAVSIAERVLQAESSGADGERGESGINRAAGFNNLSNALQARFERTGNLLDLDAAIAAAREAKDAIPAGHPLRGGALSMLSVTLRSRYERTGDLADLTAAADAAQEGADSTSLGSLDRGKWLANLATAKLALHERTGDLTDLAAAVTAAETAVGLTPAGAPDQPRRLVTLGNALHARYRQTGALTDLDAAIAAARETAMAVSAGHPDWAKRQSNLASVLHERFKQTEDLDSLNEALTAAKGALSVTPAQDARRARMLSNAADYYLSHFEQTKEPASLNDAISAARDAVRAMARDDPDRAAAVSNHGIALRARFMLTGDRPDIDDAVTALRESLTATPADQPHRATALNNLGIALITRFDRAGDAADREAAIGAWRAAVAITTAPARIRAYAARAWAMTAADAEQWQDAVAGFEAAAQQLSLVAPRSLTRRDQEHLLAEFSGLAVNAAACCIYAGRPERAVELYEQSRAILLGQALDARTDLTDLTADYPGLAEEFTMLRDRLDRLGDDADADQRRASAEAFERLVVGVRTRPGYENFLRPLPFRQLAAAAVNGPIVIVNVSRYGAHALILTSSGLLDPLPLTRLTYNEMREVATRFLLALFDLPAADAQDQITQMLRWLWDTAAGPVLSHLGRQAPPADGEPWPRLWWCLPGLLSFLPIHAAGYHDTKSDPSPRTVPDLVISSYTPTIRALLHARRPSADNQSDGAAARPGRMLVVAADTRDLPFSARETATIQALFGAEGVRVLADEQATRDTVLRALRAATRLHFAGHAISDTDDPSASCLVVSDHDRRPLTVTDIIVLRQNNADLAFLSACSTAQPGLRLIDEAIHLVSAFQIAGYRHVIGTLWPILDPTAERLASHIYKALQKAGTSDGAAVILHEATRRLRDTRLTTPSEWASHIHSGA